MKYYNSTNTMDFNWEQVATAFWKRYPNPHSTHVLSEDTINRRFIGRNLIKSQRIIGKANTQKLPKWGEKFVPGTGKMFVLEESVVDRKNKTLTTYTRNLGLQSVMTIDEKCVYKQSPDDKSKTVCVREAWICSNIYGLSRALTSFGLERFKRSSTKALAGYNHVLTSMFAPHLLEALAETGADGASKLNKFTEAAKVKTEKLKNTAHLAKEIAKAKSVPVVSCESTAAGSDATGRDSS